MMSEGIVEIIMQIAVMVGRRNIRELAKIFNQSIDISFYIDNNVRLSGEMLEGRKVYSPYDFPKDSIDYVVILI